jgi:excisionase family DNA binding protein
MVGMNNARSYRPDQVRSNGAGSHQGSGNRNLHQGNSNRLIDEVVFLTVTEVSDMMRVSKMTVYRLVHSGELEALRIGRSFRVPEDAVRQYLTDASVEP